MRPNEDEEPNAYRESQPGRRNPEQRPPAGDEGRSPPGRQQPRQGPPPGAETGQPPQSQGPPPQPQSPPPQSRSPPPQRGPPPQQGPPQQWHQPPTPPSGQPPSQQTARSVGQRVQEPTGRGTGTQPPPRSEQLRLQPVTVDDIVETDVVTAERDTPLTEIVGKMAGNDVGSVVVVEDDVPVGILTDRSIALSLEDTPDASDLRADDLLSDDLVTGTTDTSVFDVLRTLGDEGIRRLPIVDEDGTLAGIVTLDDILVLLGAELGNAVDVIEEQSPRL